MGGIFSVGQIFWLLIIIFSCIVVLLVITFVALVYIWGSDKRKWEKKEEALLNRLLAKDAWEFKALQQSHKERIEELETENDLAIENQKILNEQGMRVPIT